MTYIFTRGDKSGKWQECECNLYIDSKGEFRVRFYKTTDNIGLNDGNFHSIDRMDGQISNLIIDQWGIHLEGCFVKINDKWHKDGLSFIFKQ